MRDDILNPSHLFIYCLVQRYIMTTNQNFHQTDKMFVEQSKKLIVTAVSAGSITSGDARLIREFIDELKADSGISGTRQHKIIDTLILNREFHPEYSNCTLSDVRAAKTAIQDAMKPDGTPRFKANTQNDRVKIMKRFFLWMIENDYSSISSEKLRKLRPPSANKMTKTAEMLLTEEEVLSIIQVCKNSRDRALISVLYEGGFRIGEIGNLTWGDVHFTEVNVSVNTDFKTGKPRYVPLVASRQYLAQWKADSFSGTEPNDFVFTTTTTKKPVRYCSLRKHLQVLAARAGITKKVNPHIFRHSRITHLAQSGMSESVIKLMMWGSISSDMLSTYCHLGNVSIDSAVLELNGVALPKSKEHDCMMPAQCPRCATVNSPGMLFCGVCGAPLNDEGKTELEGVLELLQTEMENDPGFLMETFQAMKSRRKEAGV